MSQDGDPLQDTTGTRPESCYHYFKIFSKYKSARNAVCREIRKINREQQQEVAAQCKENPNLFWKFINNKRNNRSGIVDLVATDSHGNNVTVTSNDEKAIIFHRHSPKKQKHRHIIWYLQNYQ